MKQNTFVVDLDRCIGCKACMVACKMENGVALGVTRNKVLTVGPHGKYPDIEMFFIPVMCQQCADPPCVKVCPTGASYKRAEDGAVLVDRNICIGCQSCKNACPYGVQHLNKEMRVIDKCSMCDHLTANGGKPACVKTCSGKALLFGDVNDPESEVSKALAAAGGENVYSLKDCGEKPSVRYILRKAAWVDILPGE